VFFKTYSQSSAARKGNIRRTKSQILEVMNSNTNAMERVPIHISVCIYAGRNTSMQINILGHISWGKVPKGQSFLKCAF
jgi:hypothetical protein